MTKKIICWCIVLLFVCFSCGNQSESAENQDNQMDLEPQTVVLENGIVEIKTETAFEDKIATPEYWENIKYQKDIPCVIDFYATWCGPCHKISPIYDKLAKEYEGKITFYRVDVDILPNIAQTVGIEGMPTLLFIKQGVNDQILGILGEEETEAQMRQKLETLLAE